MIILWLTMMLRDKFSYAFVQIVCSNYYKVGISAFELSACECCSFCKTLSSYQCRQNVFLLFIKWSTLGKITALTVSSSFLILLVFTLVMLPSEVVNFNTLSTFNRAVKLVYFSIFLKCFQVSFILKGNV